MARSVSMACAVENTASPVGATPMAFTAPDVSARLISPSTPATVMPRTAAASAMAVRTWRMVATLVRSNRADRPASAGSPSGPGVCGATARMWSITPAGARPSRPMSSR